MVIKKTKLKNRDIYLNRLKEFQDKDFVKVITGIRRCGKSSLLKLMSDSLKESGIRASQIIEMNFESMDYIRMNAADLRKYIIKKTLPDKRMYLFFDEIQRIIDWQLAINSLMIDIDCDIYITGSNAFLLSSELSTYLSGRYVEIKVYPLSFKEFLDFHGYTVKKRKTPTGSNKYQVFDDIENYYEVSEIFDAYLMFGGMPAIADVGLEISKVNAVLDGIYSAVVVRDILERGKRANERGVSDPILLRKIVMFLADNIGSSTSARNIGNKLVNEEILDDTKRGKSPAVQTVQIYVKALLDAYIFYDIKRFDIKGKEYLSSLGKYYIVDLGLQSYLLGYRDRDSGHKIENVVYFELLRRGYDVAVGKAGNKEVDFIATRANEIIYYQVTDDVNSESTMKRELAPFYEINDNFKKVLITGNSRTEINEKGVVIENLFDFLLKD